MDNELSFDDHISASCKKINNQFNVMIRFLKRISISTMMRLYRAFILSHFHYCAIVRHFCTSRNLDKSMALSTLDCEQSLFCSKIPAGGAARKRVRYSSREPRVAWAGSPVHATRGSRLCRSPLEYRPRGIAIRAARISHSLSRRSSGRDFRAKERLLAVYKQAYPEIYCTRQRITILPTVGGSGNNFTV